MACCCGPTITNCTQCCSNLAAFPTQTSVPIDFDITLTANHPCLYKTFSNGGYSGNTFSYNFTTSVIAKNHYLGDNQPCRFFFVGALDSVEHPVCQVDGSFDMTASSGSCFVGGQSIQLFLKSVINWPGAIFRDPGCSLSGDGCGYLACCFFPVASVEFSAGTCMAGAVVQISGTFSLAPFSFITGSVVGTATFGSVLP